LALLLLLLLLVVHGHMNPLIAPAKVLLQQGHVVKFACYEELRWKFEAAGRA
jgi:UDP:flavonoid glycosyltransferase YjiC (YdhE family)